ncbi:MAG: ORF6N domain-containing protein [Kiritimatiellae bacterium]|nr:ORF6N domain-containing protein [Kiritimatiellia bacterium]
MKTELQKQNENVLSIDHVKSRMLPVRGQLTLLDRDVAELYGVKTREINQAMKNNPGKFPDGYVFQLDEAEFADWRSKILTSDLPQAEKNSIRKGLRYAPYAFTERGLYMLATILKGERATRTTLAIIDTYAQVRELARTMEALQTVKDGGGEQRTLLHRTGEILANVVSDNLKTESSETEIELNFAVVKIRHKIIRHKR